MTEEMFPYATTTQEIQIERVFRCSVSVANLRPVGHERVAVSSVPGDFVLLVVVEATR